MFYPEGESQSRRAVAVMERTELEDKHLQLMEENLVNELLI